MRGSKYAPPAATVRIASIDDRRVRGFHAIRGRAGRHRREHLVVELVHRQDDDARTVGERFDFASERDPVSARQSEVDDRDVGTGVDHRGEPFDSVGRFGGDDDPRGFERRAQAGPNERVVLDDGDADPAHRGALGNESVKIDPRGSRGA